jgi:hypothetical protein
MKSKTRNDRKLICKWLKGIVLTLIEFEARGVAKSSRRILGHGILSCYYSWECSNDIHKSKDAYAVIGLNIYSNIVY